MTNNKICRLCGKSALLRNSHILPEFLYARAYDDIHRALELGREERVERFIQQGYREELLCDACEGQFNRYETYFKRTWFDAQPLPTKLEPGIRVHTIDRLDYKLFRLFHLSLLWRASVSEHEMFEHVVLGLHEERVRRLLLAEDPGAPELYHWMATVIMSDGGVWDHVITQPVARKIDGRTVYVFVFGGCVWFYVVSGAPLKRFIPLAFGKDGRQTLLVTHARDIGVLRAFFEDFFRRGGPGSWVPR